MTLTVVIPTLERSTYVTQALKDLARQSVQNFSILIVDQSESTDSSLIEFIADSEIPTQYFHVSFQGLPLARNFAWQVSKADALVFIDDDVRIPEDFVAEHLMALGRPDVGIVAGGIQEVRIPNPKARNTGNFNFWLATPTRGFHLKVPGVVDHAPGGNFSVKRDVLVQTRGFDEVFAQGTALYEETDFCLRATQSSGLKVLFHPPARLQHLAAPSGGCRVLEITDYVFSLARNRSILIRRHLRFYHLPTAYLRLILLVFSYWRKNPSLALLTRALKGWKRGTFEVAAHPVSENHQTAILASHQSASKPPI